MMNCECTHLNYMQMIMYNAHTLVKDENGVQYIAVGYPLIFDEKLIHISVVLSIGPLLCF